MKKIIIKNPNEFRDFCTTLRSTWAFDTETTSLNWLDLKLIGFSIYDGRQACYVQLFPRHKEVILDIFEYYLNEANMIIMHNAPFDLMVLKKEGIEI